MSPAVQHRAIGSPSLALALWLGALTLGLSPSAHASAYSVFGAGPEAVGQSSAVVARSSDGTASFYNPAGLAFSQGYHLQLGGLGAWSALKAQNKTLSITDGQGFSGALDLDVPLEGPLAHRVRVGLALYAPPKSLMHLRVHPTSEPFFPYYDNRTQRMAIMPSLAVRLLDELSLGVGADVLAGVTGPVNVREGQSQGLETRIEEQAQTQAALIAGLRFDPYSWLHLALVYRAPFSVPVRVNTTASIAGVPLVVNITQSQALFDPATVVLGAAFAPCRRVNVELDASYQHWSSWSGPLLGIDTTVSALALSTRPLHGLFQDSYGLRSGADWLAVDKASWQLHLHAGAGWESSMLDSRKRQGRSNLVDGDKLIASTGASARLASVLGRPMRLGLGLQMQQLVSSTQAKKACTALPCPDDTVVGPDSAQPDQGIDNPGYPALKASGRLFIASLGLEVQL